MGACVDLCEFGIVLVVCATSGVRWILLALWSRVVADMEGGLQGSVVEEEDAARLWNRGEVMCSDDGLVSDGGLEDINSYRKCTLRHGLQSIVVRGD